MMPDTFAYPTLPQLLDSYRRTFTDYNSNAINELARLTYHSSAIEDSGLTLAQTRHLI